MTLLALALAGALHLPASAEIGSTECSGAPVLPPGKPPRMTPYGSAGDTAFAMALTTAVATTPIQLDIARYSPIGGTPVSSAVGDFDGDGRIDLVVTDTGGDSLVLVLAPLTAAPQRRRVDLPGAAFDVAAGDLDGDGRPDLVCSLWDRGQVAVLRNAGGASFPTAVTLPCGPQPRGVALADLDRDGDLDLAVALYDANSVRVFLNRGDGTFGDGVESVVGAGPVTVLAADANGDGALDLITGDAGCTTISCLPNRGDGTFGPRLTTRIAEVVYTLAAGDLDGDGHLDLAVSTAAGGRLLWGDGSGRFVADAAFVSPAGYDVAGAAVADLDGDGRLDLVFPEASHCSGCFAYYDLLRVYRNLGGRTFERGLGFRSVEHTQTLRAADLDDDGRPDLVALALGGYPFRAGAAVLRGRGLGVLGGIAEYAFWPSAADPRYTERIRVAEAVRSRADGLSDLVVQLGYYGWSPRLQLMRNADGSGFDAPVDLGPGTLVAVSDLDGDGRSDLIVARGDTLETRRGLPGSAFAPPVTVGTGITFLTLGEFDADGRFDLVVRDSTWRIFLARGQSDGTFGSPVATNLVAPNLYGYGADVFGAGDLDADDRYELISVRPTWDNRDTLEVYKADPGGTFQLVKSVGLPGLPDAYHPIPSPVQVLTHDLDGDGRADVLVLFTSPEGLNVLTSSADGSLTVSHIEYLGYEPGEAGHVVVGEMTGDGIPDIVASEINLNDTSILHFLTGRGDGTFDVTTGNAFGDDACGLTLGRFDADSRLDLAYVSSRGNWLAVALNVPPTDISTPVLASLVSASVVDGRASLVWSVGAAGTVVVQRNDDGLSWVERSRLSPDGDGRVQFVDAGLRPGARYGYRLAFVSAGRTVTAGETWLDVPASAQLALSGARPNPVTGDLTVAFSLDRRTAGTLALFDIAGRRIATSDFDALAPGEHRVRLAAAGALRPGLYLIRLATAGRTLTARAVVVR